MKLTQTIDTVIALDKRIAELRKERDAHAAKIKAEGPGTYEGTNGVATVFTSIRKTLDMKKVRAKLSHQFIAKNTKEIETINIRITEEAA